MEVSLGALKEEVRGAVARGWCHPLNEKKEMDPDLALAISDEVQDLYWRLWREDRDAKLGCATTNELLEELKVRAEMSRFTDNNWGEYRTVDRCE